MLREPIQRIALVRARGAVVLPAFRAEVESHGYELDDGLEAFEAADDVGAVRPGAAAVEVQDVAVRGGGKAGVGRGGDGVAEGGGGAVEGARSGVADVVHVGVVWVCGHLGGSFSFVLFFSVLDGAGCVGIGMVRTCG